MTLLGAAIVGPGNWRYGVRDLWAGWLGKGGLYVRTFLLASGLPRKDHVLKLTVLPKSDKAEGNLIRIGGFCVTNPKP